MYRYFFKLWNEILFYNKFSSIKGFGGGFMERDEIVEYKERIEEDDDEYDEVWKIVFIDVTGNHSDLEIKVPKCMSLMHSIRVMKQNIPIKRRSLMK